MEDVRAAVVLTVFDEAPDRLEQAVGSILGQSETALDIVIIDDGSTDPDTRACLRQLARRDGRIRLERIANQGPGGAANAGLRLARAPLVFRHDSDDWSEPDRFARQLAHMDAHPDLVMLGTGIAWHQEDGKTIARWQCPLDPGAVRAAFPRGNPMTHGSLCLRREAVTAIGGYRPQLRYGEDYDLCWRLSERGDGANLPEVLYHHRFHAGSVSVRRFQDRHRYRAAVRLLARSRALGEEIAVEDALHRAAAQECSAAAVFTGLGDDMMRAGRFRGALRAYLRGLARPGSPRDALMAGAKLGRLALFAAAPCLRQHLFAEAVRKPAR